MREVDTRTAARLLELSRKTLYKWAADALAGRPARVRNVRRAVNGNLLFDRDELLQLKRDQPRSRR